jgi:hypothetical protein
MTRDSYRVHDDRGISIDADVYAALLRTSAPFPRLPEDAPSDLKKLTIDLDDPKRIYAVHRASRRHNFQILVERSVGFLQLQPFSHHNTLMRCRYTHQIRYGCQSRSCTTTTCFSSRRRLAAGAPVRRYNATSARTLAIYMASQDNPEQGLCHHPRSPQSISEITKATNSKRTLEELQIYKQDTQKQGESKARINSSECVSTEGNNTTAKQVRCKPSVDDTSRRRVTLDLSVLEEPTNTDPRSLVQNVFGSVAFKMLEWLTPRNIDALIRAQERDSKGDSLSEVQETVPEQEKALGHSSDNNSQLPASSVTSETASDISDKENRIVDKKASPNKRSEPLGLPATIPNAQLLHAREPKFPAGSDGHPNSVSKLLTRNEPLDSQHLKGILTKSPKQSDITTDVTPQSRQYMSPIQRRLSRQSSSTNSRVMIKDAPESAIPEVKSRPAKVISPSSEYEETKDQDEIARVVKSSEHVRHGGIPHQEVNHEDLLELQPPLLPQSLAYLSIEIVEYLCDLMQKERISEKHPLHPMTVGEDLKRTREISTGLSHAQTPRTSKRAWKAFIEQSFFHVFSTPESLLRSFRDEEKRPFDTQTIWYLMLRVTRVSPSIIFDCLWRMAGALFQPPEKLKSTHEWAKDFQRGPHGSSRPMTNHDAAEAINLCFHALIAAAPLASSKQELASMSRIRSYGLVMRGSEAASQEHINLCLQYEDAFTYDLAMRLARRVFAAIPTRRRFTELLELQKDVRDDEKPEPDVLETIIKSLDLGTEPVLKFSDAERDLHEKRAPTLILDWARTVMLQEWQGAAEVPSDGPFGGALATMNAICKSRFVVCNIDTTSNYSR